MSAEGGLGLYRRTIYFCGYMISLDLSGLQLKLKQAENNTLVFDPVRKKWVVLTPEEHVRQYLLQYMIINAGYPAPLIAVEKQIKVGTLPRRFDIVVYNREHKPWLLCECKEPAVPISEHTLYQLLAYQRSVESHFWLLTNGHQTYCADARDTRSIHWLDSLPAYQ